MRKALIVVGGIATLACLWPFVGQHAGAAAAVTAPHSTLLPTFAPKLTPVAFAKPKSAKSSKPSKREIMASCYQQYRAVHANCGVDQACRLHAGDQWDQCEASGAWPR